jgi:hypothetical protein
MSRILTAPEPSVRVFGPTTTRKFAQRMLNASGQVARALPPGFHTSVALDILLALHVAEDDACYLSLGQIGLPGACSAEARERWLDALVADGLVDRRGELLALSEKGYALVVDVIESIYLAQRALD